MFYDVFKTRYIPLADRFVPEDINQIRGQEHLLGEGGILRRILEARKPLNLLFYGPPGTGKTQVAKLISKTLNIPYVKINACTLKPGEWKKSIYQLTAKNKGSTLLILDEVHRLNKLQQEFLLPYLETGEIYLVGITSANPFFTLSAALLSRVLPLEFKKLSYENIMDILKSALADADKGLGLLDVEAEESVLRQIALLSDGDARRALSYLEALTLNKKPPIRITQEDLKQIGANSFALSPDEFYDNVSAFIKSMRGGDKEASIYYMLRLLKGGVDPRYLIRRMLIFAAEDVGLANPFALVVTMAGGEAFERVGDEEGKIILSFLAQYLALQKKSNDALSFLKRAEKVLDRGEKEDVPPFLRHGRRRKGKYINPHKSESEARKQKYISDKLREKIRGKEV